jgi:RecB family exonuclease
VWDERGLLRDLELRLGLPPLRADGALRIQHWSRAFAELAKGSPRFYSRSHAADPLGTTKALLEWRDELVLAGWDGQRMDGGGARLDALAEAEAAGVAKVAPGLADRVRRLEQELSLVGVRCFDALELVEDRQLWPERWRRVLVLLEASGVPVQTVPQPVHSLASEGDLRLLQAALLGLEGATAPLAGDGSLILLRGETTWELAQAAAALLAGSQASGAVVIRGGDAAALEAACAARGLPSQGWTSQSPWRPALQVLSLAIELEFEPRDPGRVLELVTLPHGPFRGALSRELARAIGEAPGIGGRPWQLAKQRLRDGGVAIDALQRVSDWFERPGAAPDIGAPKQALLAASARVREWLRDELANVHATLGTQPEPRQERAAGILHSAYRQLVAFEQSLQHDLREHLRLTEVRQLLEETSGPGHALAISTEGAGRVDHVEQPAALRVPRDTVLWWHCAAGTEWRPAPQPWRRAELEALAAAGVRFVDPKLRLAAESNSWRQAVLAARRQLILCVPGTALGRAVAPHPMVDEIMGHLAATEPEIASVTWGLADLLGRNRRALPPRVRMREPVEVHALALPEARVQWTVAPTALAASARYSASSLESLVQCPLRWLLRYRAGLRAGSRHALPSGALLNGKLGHRLIEELHLSGALRDAPSVREAAGHHFDRLVREEAAVLLRAGESSELSQLKAQLCSAVEALARLLTSAELEVIGVEETTEAPWRGGVLDGRLDLLLRDRSGGELVVDIKWGRTSHRTLLEKGQALQLASYAALRRLSRGSALVPSAYFSLSRAELLTTQPERFGCARTIAGPDAAETWQRLEATAGLVEAQLKSGRVPVAGVRRSLPLVQACGAPANDGEGYLQLEPDAGCKYCDYPAICGRRWQESA